MCIVLLTLIKHDVYTLIKHSEFVKSFDVSFILFNRRFYIIYTHTHIFLYKYFVSNI